jgi:hypothetical protein
MKKGLLLLFVLIFVSVSITVAQTVSINNKKFVVNGNASCPIYLNGANTPWESWNDFGGSYSSTKWGQDLVDLKNKGINSTRIWFSCNGAGQPSIAADGTVSAPTAAFWANCDDLFSQAQTNGIYIYATMMSFDHTKTGNPNANNWIAMMSSPAKIQTYITNYLVPFVNRYKTNPYFLSVDLCNEIEWIAENGPGKGDGTNWGASYATLQQFVGLCAAGLHQTSVARTDGSMVLVTLGSACVKWNGSKLPSGGTNPDGNKWSDANLKAQTSNNANAYLDFYSPHFYGWMESSYSSPFEKTPTQYGMDEKPCIVAEMPSRDPMPTPAMSLTTAFNNLKTGGWQGHMPWTANITTNLTTEVGDLADFGAAAQTFATNNSTLVKPTCTTACATTAPTVTASVTYCQNATATVLTATGTALKWYANNTTTTALTGAPTPLTTATGTTNYYVSQTLSGCEGPRAVIAVTVNALPTATITTTTPTTFCTGGSVVLTSSAGSSYKWNNAAGVIAGATNSTYTATAAGSYTVTVTNANNCSATSTATTVTVNTLPTATISTTTPTTFCTGGSVVLTSSTGSSYKWNNAAGVIAGATNSTYTATAAGSYTVTVTNANNCSATSTATTVTVNTLPTATISTTTSTTFCTGGSVVLTSSAGSSYKWNNAAGVIAGATNSTYTATTAGSYTVTVTNANNCSATSTATAVTVNAAPTVTITTTTPTTFCTGGSVVLTSSAGSSYQWNNAAGVITGATNSTYTAITAGSYTVTVTNAGGCSGTSTSTATTVTVNALPTATITTTTPTTICTGGSVVLTSSAGSSYKWNNAAGVIAGATNSTYAATTAGSYTVTVTNANNCFATSTATTVTVNTLPTATITTTTPITFCTGGSVGLNANTGTGLTYKWNNAAGVIAGATNATYTATTAGTYTVTVTNANNCSATSTGTIVTVNTTPTAAVSTATSTTFCTGGSVGLNANTGTGLTYKWNNATGVIAGATSATYTATTAGSYTVTVTNANNCSATSTATTVTVSAAPTATISTTTPTTFCTGGSVVLTSSAGSSYKWNNAAGVIAGATSATYTATTAGSYTVTVTNGSNCSATSVATTVTVNAAPTAMITTTTPTTFCTGGSVVLTSSTGSSYQWSNAAGVITGATSAAYTATTTGSYTVTVMNGSNCSATSTATSVTVNAVPTAMITTTTSTTFCTGGSVLLTSSTGSSYKWNNAAGVIAGATNSTYTATVAGSYTVTVTNANNCSATSTATTVTVSAALVWYQDADGDGKGDPGVTQTSCIQPTGYVSMAGDGCPSDPNKIAPGVCGCGNLETDTDGDGTPDCVDTDDDNDGVPDTTDCAPLNASIGAATVWYQDIDGDGEGSTTGIIETSCTQPVGYVSVAGDDCPNDPNKTTPGICGCGKAEGTCTTTGVQNSLSVILQIYPNPSESEFTIIAAAGEFTVTCYNASGLEVLKGTYDSEAQMGAELKQGMYLIRIEQGGMIETRKIIKK